MDTFRIYTDKHGNKVDPFEFPVSHEECKNYVDFCCVATVPEGFAVTDIQGDLINTCVDYSGLSCILEKQHGTATIDNPCNGELTVPVTFYAVRLMGCAKVYASGGPVLPRNSQHGPTPPPSHKGCTIGCGANVCVDQILTYTTDDEHCEKCCFEPTGGLFDFFPGEDACGNSTLVITGRQYFEYLGCILK